MRPTSVNLMTVEEVLEGTLSRDAASVTPATGGGDTLAPHLNLDALHSRISSNVGGEAVYVLKSDIVARERYHIERISSSQAAFLSERQALLAECDALTLEMSRLKPELEAQWRYAEENGQEITTLEEEKANLQNENKSLRQMVESYTPIQQHMLIEESQKDILASELQTALKRVTELESERQYVSVP
jgi:DNA repair exonuclease SbcCD ATPase subunit